MTFTSFPLCQSAIDRFNATMLIDSVQIRRQTATTDDGAGGQKPSSGDGWTTIETVDGLLIPVPRRSPAERAMASQITGIVDHFVYVEHDVDVRPRDRLVIGTRTFEVQGIPKAEAAGFLDEVSCVELQK